MSQRVLNRYAVVELAVMPARHRLNREAWSQSEALTALHDALGEMKKVLPRLLSDYELDFAWNIEVDAVCEHCNFRWTEDATDFNGGCCDADLENDPLGAQGMSAGTAETLQAAQGNARQPGPATQDAPNHDILKGDAGQ